MQRGQWIRSLFKFVTTFTGCLEILIAANRGFILLHDETSDSTDEAHQDPWLRQVSCIFVKYFRALPVWSTILCFGRRLNLKSQCQPRSTTRYPILTYNQTFVSIESLFEDVSSITAMQFPPAQIIRISAAFSFTVNEFSPLSIYLSSLVLLWPSTWQLALLTIFPGTRFCLRRHLWRPSP